MVSMPRSEVVARLLLGFKHNGAGTVSEQHAGAAVVPVENSRECLGADHQRALERAGAQEIVRGGKRENKPRANRLQIEGRAMVDAEPILHRNRGGGKGIVRRRGRQHNEVDRLRIDPGIGERGTRGMERQM